MNDNYTELYEKLSRLQWLLHRQHLQTHSEGGPMADPSRGQGRVVAILKLQPEISTKDLSYLLGIRQQSLNELLNKLEKAGFVERNPSETDRRVMMVRLTEEGRTRAQTEGDPADFFDCLNAEERAAFGEYLDRVIAALGEKLDIGSDDELYDWMESARSRMGDEMFERLMAKRGGPWRGHGGPQSQRGLYGHHGPRYGHREGGCPGRDGFGRRGPAPKDRPGAERFDPDYDGPVPDRDETPPFSPPRDPEDK